jgi:elongator complex protein 3
MGFYDEILDLILKNKVSNKSDLHNAKIVLCRKYNLSRVPSDSDILEHAPEDIYYIVEPMLRLKPMRTISGVAPVAVMTSPNKCPHGTCAYCPGGIDYGSAQSYTGFEPAAMRASSNNFDPFLQTRSRLEQLKAIGHPTDKIDLIIMGGTFTARENDYQNWFIRGCLSALNGHKTWNQDFKLKQLQPENETAPHRCIGMTIETRPDWCKQQEVNQILNLGGTRVELGVQTVYDDILSNVSRGHTVSDSIESTMILKDSGLKVCYHIMPGLPNSSFDRDKKAFDILFNDPNFKPDMLKIYPTLVVKGTELYKQWTSNYYEPLSTEKAVDLIAYLKTQIPKWVRIQRIQRDIPVQYIEAGVDKSNLRQMVLLKLNEAGEKCNCIRCREVGHLSLKGIDLDPEHIELQIIEYDASKGNEVFLSYEDTKNDIIIAFARIRLPSVNTRRSEFYLNGDIPEKPERPNTAIIRELKVFGQMVPLDKDSSSDSKFLNDKNDAEWQHKGYGQLLLENSEKYSIENWDVKKLLILSGIGVRQYYSKLGYHRDGIYMGKKL